tara:strand:- start:850 stop:1155 length:306 start_codon:yes stop_codon:yes gene_type:complete
MEKEEEIYVSGGGKEMFDGNVVNFALDLSKVQDAKEWWYEMNGKKYLNLKVCKKREVDQYGKSHRILVNTWKPEKPQAAQEHASPTPPPMPEDFYSEPEFG